MLPAFMTDATFRDILYIVSFALFIIGLSGLRILVARIVAPAACSVVLEPAGPR